MSGWRYLAQRLTGNGATSEMYTTTLPLKDVQITRTLSGPGRLTGTVPIELSALQGEDGRPVLQEWGTAIWAEKDNIIRGGGILANSSFVDQQWSLDCVGFTGYAAGMPYDSAWFGVEIDPLDVVRHIWSHIQAHPGGNLGIEVDDTKVGKLIGIELAQGEFDTQNGPLSYESGPVKLNWYTTTDLGSEIDKLAVAHGFEYREETRWDYDTLRHRLILGVPTVGRRRDDLRFVIGENIQVRPQINLDGEFFANEVLVMGAGEGSSMIHSTTSNPDGRLRRPAVVVDKNVRSTVAANVVGAAALRARQGLLDITSVVVRDHPNAPNGTYDPGDEILLQGKNGWIELDDWVRVISVTTSPETGDDNTLDVQRIGGPS